MKYSRAKLEKSWIAYPLYEQKLFTDKVRFLNHDAPLPTKSSWNDQSQAKLWLYNLHYFDDLCGTGCEKRVKQHTKLIEQWIEENPAPLGNGWEPYPTSLRIVNWIKAFLSNIEPTRNMLDSLATQADYLSQDLEKHLLGNHLFVNAKALIFAGLFFQGNNAQKWLALGEKIYSQQLDEQVLKDGGNFELTPMYHAIMMIDLLDLVNLSDVFPNKLSLKLVHKTKEKIKYMLCWLKAMSHDDGRISFFNDSAFGIAPENSTIEDYASSLGISTDLNFPSPEPDLHLFDLKESGFVSVKSMEFSLIADLAEVGASYIPGHAHADTLSFEFALNEDRVFVNAGISEYGVSDERLLQRKTKSHNTVSINGLDSSQVWSGFRVAKRAEIIDRNVQFNSDNICFHAAHNGFIKQGVNCVHKRKWHVAQNNFMYKDSFSGNFESAEAYLILHPLVKIRDVMENKLILKTRHSEVEVEFTNAELSIVNCNWNPEFGVQQNTKKLCFNLLKSSMEIQVCWRKV
ncbi:MAG: heparinase II/III family protein [Kangiellaceae bacterium]|nr:heparinase II/III family protein [Kangiellaceae bacterium]MCW8997990.1 heparinase II/III family protein [Kangiellaceae bacterium]MCW9015769.1 heparinase II/III family protein [Kangiellaceae bacterium]